MKKKSMLTNSVYVFSALLIGIAVCVSVWFSLKEHKNRGIPTQENSSREHQSGAPINNKVTSDPDGNPEEELLTPEQRVARRSERNFLAMQSEEDLARPYMQKLLEATDPDSPEFLEYLKDMRENGPSFRKWNDFLESQGVPVKREFSEMFRKAFPTGEPEDYDPEMRLKLAELFLAQEPVDPADPIAAAMQRMRVVRELQGKDPRHRAWLFGRFGDDGFDGYARIERDSMESSPALVWMTDVQRNAASIVANVEAAGAPGIDTDPSASSWDMSSVMESPSASDSETEIPTMPDTSARERMADAEIEAAIEKSLTPQLSDIPTTPSPDKLGEIQSNLETTLKSQFSSERFERAMDTLDKYGPEEGLRHLRENDPEVAKQIEQHQNNKGVSQ